MKKHYETHVEDTDKLISVAGPVLDYKSWYEQYRKLMEEQAQRKYGLYTPTSEGDDDDFPSIPGMIARYSALGLTNEQMAANPVWVDKTGNGHDLQLKNFAWSGMSGVGGYSDNFSSDSWKKPSDRSDITWTSSSFNITRVMNTGVQIYYFSAWEESESVIPEKRIIVKGLEDGQVLRYMNVGNRIIEISQDGIYTIPSFTFKGANSYHGYSLAKKQESCNVTVEQLPLYPGALVFDGVDDYGTCDNFPILNKEKGYTVVALRSYLAESIGYLVYNGTNAKQSAFAFERSDSLDTWSWGKNSSIRNLLPKLMSYQTSNSYNNNIISTGTAIEGDKLIRIASVGGYSNVAIWELVFLDHDATEEELTKIKDYFVKTYPWLFPDQAWTVTGKTNEDEDRATISNITGNGNDLVLSNFAFSGNSGYGSYVCNFNDTSTWIYYSYNGTIEITSSTIHVTEAKTARPFLEKNASSGGYNKVKIKVTGIKDGEILKFMSDEDRDNTINIEKDGIYSLPGSDKLYYGFRLSNSTNTYPFNCDITIEQIPEYEGYLVTDGVDDVASSKNFVFEPDFTFIGEWKFIQKDNTVAGINSSSHLYIQNRYNRGATVMINSTSESKKNITDYMTFKAITSKGKAYDENWNEVDLLYGDGFNDRSAGLNIGGQGSSDFCHMLFKNMALYMNKVFSKDECIKAYNYLQTLKAK
jgi:hypothetical protein